MKQPNESPEARQQNIKTITEDFDKLLLYNTAVVAAMTYHQMGILSESEALKLAVITLAQQIEQLQDEVARLMFGVQKQS